MVHAISGLVLVFTFCVFPCAANTKPRFKDAAHMAKHARGKKKNAVEPEEAEPVKATEMNWSEEKEVAMTAAADVENNAPAPTADLAPAAADAGSKSSEPKKASEAHL